MLYLIIKTDDCPSEIESVVFSQYTQKNSFTVKHITSTIQYNGMISKHILVNLGNPYKNLKLKI